MTKDPFDVVARGLFARYPELASFELNEPNGDYETEAEKIEFYDLHVQLRVDVSRDYQEYLCSIITDALHRDLAASPDQAERIKALRGRVFVWALQ